MEYKDIFKIGKKENIEKNLKILRRYSFCEENMMGLGEEDIIIYIVK